MPQDRTYMVTEAMLLGRDWHRRQAPFYRVEEVSKTFFAMSASWLRLKMATDAEHPETWFVRSGERMRFRRSKPEKPDSARVFTLADIEPMAYSLHDFGAIDAARLSRILNVVQAEAQLYGLFDDPPVGPGDDDGAEELDTEPADA